MPCYKPNLAFQHKYIKQKLRFTGLRNYRDENGINPYETEAYKYYSRNENWKPINIPCGQCLDCRLKKSQEKGIRSLHEASGHSRNCFLTLTYDSEHLPEKGHLNFEHPKNFIKRLRDKISREGGGKILTTGCAEYGEKLGRPHYHIIIFGYDFEDKEFFRYSENDWSPKKWPVYISQTLRELWPYGNHEIGSVTYESACYVARYTLKKITGKNAQEAYGDKPPERSICISNRRGIGKDWLMDNINDCINHDQVFIEKENKIDHFPLPRYYSKMIEKYFPEQFKKIKQKRLDSIKEIDKDLTKDRLQTRKKVRELRQKKQQRNLEKE